MVGAIQTWRQVYSFDRYGNRNFASGTTTITGCPTNICNPTVNPANNRFNSGQGYTYDLSGNTISDAAGRTYIYDAENKQKQVKNSANQTIGTYYFDGDGKRIKKVTASKTVTFVYDAGGKLVAEYSTLTPQATPVTRYLTSDHLGSPRIITGSNGAVLSRRDFMPYGEEAFIGVGNRAVGHGYTYGDSTRQKFTGYERDEETNLDFAQARMYSNQLGRFITVDPLLASANSSNPQTFNRYVYVLNNPLALIDRTGAFPEFTFSVYVRSFAPYQWFGPGNVARGDNRGFSTDPNKTYRIQAFSRVTAADDGRYFPMSMTQASEATTSETNLGFISWTADSECYINDPNGNYFADGLPGGNDSLGYHMYGNDDAIPFVSSDIDLHPELRFNYADQGDGVVNMTVTGAVTGDQFPAAEAFIRDSNGNSVMLGVFAPTASSGPVTSLPGNGTSPMINVDVTVQVNNGVFQGVVENGKVISLDEYNRRFTSQSPVRENQ